jgi:hypothetical protein
MNEPDATQGGKKSIAIPVLAACNAQQCAWPTITGPLSPVQAIFNAQKIAVRAEGQHAGSAPRAHMWGVSLAPLNVVANIVADNSCSDSKRSVLLTYFAVAAGIVDGCRNAPRLT